MNIVIAGLGKFGKELTEHLSKEGHNITVIDNKSNVVEDIVNRYDVMGIVGNAASYDIQKDAKVSKSDLFIATTATDELNILCCLVAKKLGAKQTITRLRNPEYGKQAQLMRNELGITLTLNPDLDTAREIFRTMRFPSAIQVETFANGKVDLVEIKLDKKSVLVNKSLIEISNKYQVKILVCAVKRGSEVFIPKGDFVLQEGDYVYLTAEPKELTKAFKKFSIFKEKLKSALILGGGRITYYLANMLIENGTTVKIFDKDIAVCKSLCESIPKSLIVNADGTNHQIMIEEGIAQMDAVITLTGMDETNIIISSFAQSLNCDKVITKVNNTNYDLILNNIGLESVVSPKDIFASHIIRYVRGMENHRGSEFKTLYRLVGNKVEALEFVIPKATKYTSIPLKDLRIKENHLLACIIRNNKVIIPGGLTTLEPLDSVVIVTTNTSIKDVSDILE